MFDDGWKSQFTVGYNYMKKKNMVGSISIIPQMVGEIDYINKGDFQTLHNSDWDLLNHTYSHKNLSKIDDDEQFYEISRADNWLSKNSLSDSPKILVYPEGDYTPYTRDILATLGYVSGRSTLEGFNPKAPKDLYEIKVKSILNSTKVSDVYEWINYTIENNLTLILLFHRLEDNADDSFMKYRKDDFYMIIDYIDKKRNDLNIITYSDWIRTIVNPEK